MDWRMLYQAPLWTLSRPQQMIFQGAKEGAKGFEHLAHRFDEQGYSPEFSDTMAAIGSLLPGIKGALRALNPQSTDVSGSDLTEGLTEGQTLDKAIGLGLDLAADPLNAPLGVGGRVMGTMGRTIPNLMRIRRAAMTEEPAMHISQFAYDVPSGTSFMHKPSRWLDAVITEEGSFPNNFVDFVKRHMPESSIFEVLNFLHNPDVAAKMQRTTNTLSEIERIGDRTAALKAIDRLGKKKWLLDIPVVPHGNEPISIRTGDRVIDIHNRLFRTKSNLDLGGFYRPDANLLAYDKNTQKITLPHEMFHWSTDKTPWSERSAIDELLATLPDKLSETADYLRKGYSGYRLLPPSGLGEEIAAEKMGRIGIDFFNDYPELMSTAKRALGAIRPEHYQDAPRIPLEVLYNTEKIWQALGSPIEGT